MAALLACRPGAVLSHRSAAALFLRADVPRTDIRRREGMSLTSPPRTILDLAGELGLEDLERLLAEADYRRLASGPELRGQLERNPGRRGNAVLRSVLDLPGGPARTRSHAEQRMLHLLREAGVTGYELNRRIHGFEVDVLWRELGFAVEIDGYDAHSGRLAFERDRLKVATLKARGLDVMPVTPRQLRDDPDGVLARLLRGLELVGYRGSD